MANTSVYAATKAALLTLACTLSTELLPRRIRVNAISPGPVTTEILKKTGLSAEQVNGFKEALTNQDTNRPFR